MKTIKTRAAVLRERTTITPYRKSKPLSIETVSLREPQEGELLVKIKAAGLCHSDLSVINGDRPRPLPMVLGHEAAGVVVKVGARVADVGLGDHVILTLPSCGNCLQCNSGRAVLCDEGIKANTEGTLLNGGVHLADSEGKQIYHHLGISAFAEYAVVSQHSVIPIDKTLPFDVAAVFGCAVITGVGAIINRAKLRPEHSVLILGLGGIGLAALMAATAIKAKMIIVVDQNSEKLKIAQKLGATHTFVMQESAIEDMKALCPGGVDVAADFTGSAQALEFAFQTTKRGGMTLSAGLPPPDAKITINPTKLVAEERKLVGSYLGSGIPQKDIQDYIKMYQEGRLPVDQLITHRINFDDINLGFDRLQEGQAIRQIIMF